MKTTLIALIILISLTEPGQAQNPYSDALATFDTKALTAMKAERAQDRIHKELVLETITIAKSLNVRIHREAAPLLDEIYVTASEKVAGQPERSEQTKLYPANRTRFVARLISLAEPTPTNSIITVRTIRAIKDEIASRMRGFCPCFPFC